MAGISIASADLLLHIEPLPLEQLILHDMATVCSWPHAARGELFAVARRDIAVARRNLARLTHYIDLQDDHLAACDGALDDRLPLMSVEMFSRPTGGGAVGFGRSQSTEVSLLQRTGMAVTPSGV